jgi:hypothetical protein
MCEQQHVHLTAAHSADVARAPRESWLADAVAREIIAFVSAPTRASAGGRGCARVRRASARSHEVQVGLRRRHPVPRHHYKKAGDYAVRIVATDDLGHSAIGKNTVHITG